MQQAKQVCKLKKLGTRDKEEIPISLFESLAGPGPHALDDSQES